MLLRRFFLLFVGVGFSTSLNAQCNAPILFLGNDTTICAGQTLLLSPGNYNSYLWDNFSQSSVRNVFAAGTYHVKVGSIGPNTIVNGDFEQGNTSFTTDYTIGTGGAYGQLSNEGTYAISTSPSSVHNNFSSCPDHTPAPGTQMMIVNGSNQPNTNVWCQTVNVVPNTEYQFSLWTSSALNDNNVAQLQFKVNGGIIGALFSPSPLGCTWSQFAQSWNSGIQTTAQLCIVNQNTGVSGNDFMIDDIKFSPLCYQYDTIVVTTVPAPVITVTPNDTICKGETGQLTASSTTPNITYTWNPGGIVGPVLSVSPLVTTPYTVTGVSQQGCSSNVVSKSIVVSPDPEVNLNAPDSICEGNSLTISALSSIPNLTYLWQPNLSTTDTLIDSPITTTNYSLEVTSIQGCKGYDTVVVKVVPALSATILGELSYCDGGFTTLYASGNQGQMNFTWSDFSTDDSLVVSSSNNETVVLTGSYWECPTTTDTVEIIVQPNPMVDAGQGSSVCRNDYVTLNASVNQSGSTLYWEPIGSSNNPIEILALESMYYYVYAMNGDCISSMDSVRIEVNPFCLIEVPNVFSPNGDGANDFFQLIGYDGLTSIEFKILNRWGQVLVQFDQPNFAWNGKDENGKDFDAGTYFYVLEATTYSNEKLNRQGFFHIQR